jgi:hypothetical protein
VHIQTHTPHPNPHLDASFRSSTPDPVERLSTARGYARGITPNTGRSPLHTVYMSAESITKALADPVDEPEEVIAIAAAA